MGGAVSSAMGKKKPRECKCDDFDCQMYRPNSGGYKLVGKGITGTASQRQKLCDAKNQGGRFANMGYAMPKKGGGIKFAEMLKSGKITKNDRL
jgi:hypothetical protein